ncbi:MAG: phage/plasmid primase, P4 family [Steroidobacteraceae bacterium]
MTEQHSIADIAEMLNARMSDLALHLLGEPNRALSTREQLRYGSKGSVAVDVAGDKAGKWYDHESGVGGDGLELVCHVMNLRNGAACNWAKNWLGIENKPGLNIGISTYRAAPSEQPKNDKAERVADILKGCGPIEGTPAECYLKRRGIKALPLACVQFRPHAYAGYGALVAQATDENGYVLAIQQIYLTDAGEKAPLPVVKRTNKAVEKWAEKSAVRFPGKQPLILAEGVETALSLWQATGQETWACLGISNIGSAPVTEGTIVTVARDGDLPGSKADGQIKRAIAKLQKRGLTVKVATPPEGKDFNDVLRDEGEEAVRALIDKAENFQGSFGLDQARTVFIGSDVEIAGRVREDLIDNHGRIVHAEGHFWRYAATHWKAIPDHELRLATHIYDGAHYKTPKGEPTRVKLGKGRVDSILNELAALLTEETFFTDAPVGINCRSGFIRFAPDGSAQIEPHEREHRCRHTLPGHWQADYSVSGNKLLDQLLHGVFHGDADADQKTSLLAEVCGSAALGYATKLIQPRAVILKGERAENGKSQILDLARGLLPVSAISSVTAARMGDERHVIGLAGKLLNASDELSSSAAVASETFKAIITGEPVDGRDVYKSRVEFRPVAQHVFATNTLPPFQGGMDRGVQRRLLVITFNRIIPIEERVEAIGRRIAVEEADQLLAWAVQGASRLIRQRNFTIPPSSKVALTDWILGADPVLAWLDECVEVRLSISGSTIATRAAYEQFQTWAVAEGFNRDKLPAINGFVQRVLANAAGVESKRTNTGRVFIGLSLKRSAVTATYTSARYGV